jgi:hypothetical protein
MTLMRRIVRARHGEMAFRWLEDGLEVTICFPVERPGP